MKRRHKAIWAFSLVFVIFGGLAVAEPGVRLPFMFYFLGYITGLIVYSTALDAEEREKKLWKFQDDVYMNYEGVLVETNSSEDEAINQTAIRYDTSPSDVRRIVSIYEGHNDDDQ